jgi:hypothetical protein
MGEMRNAYKIGFGKPEGKRPLGRPKHGRGDVVRMYCGEMEYEG